MEAIKEYFRDWKVTYTISEVDYVKPVFALHLAYLILSILISLFFTFTTFLYIFTPYLLINLVPTITLMIRRLNELNLKPIILVLWLVPIVGWLYMTFILLSEPWEYEESKTMSFKDIKTHKIKHNNKIVKKSLTSKVMNLAAWSKLKK